MELSQDPSLLDWVRRAQAPDAQVALHRTSSTGRASVPKSRTWARCPLRAELHVPTLTLACVDTIHFCLSRVWPPRTHWFRPHISSRQFHGSFGFDWCARGSGYQAQAGGRDHHLRRSPPPGCSPTRTSGNRRD